MSVPVRRSIQTEYHDILFRSKLEADWARCFDALGVEWEYEPKGMYFGQLFYCPDFWLPKSRQWVEVKGVFEPSDCRKIQALLAHAKRRPHTAADICPDIPIVACEPAGVFRGWERTDTPREDWWQFLTKSARDVELFACTLCGGWWFADAEWSWRCQCCGAYAGNAHIASNLGSPLPEFPNTNALHFLAPHD